MALRRKINEFASRIMYALVIALICGSFAAAKAQDDVTGRAYKGAALLKKREKSAARDIDKYATQLEKTSRALTRLGQAESNELRKRYESFSKELKKLEEAQKSAVSSIDKMKAAGVEYVSSWEKANASISDAELREEAARRRSVVVLRHIELGAALGDIGLHLQPFMSRLHDLRAFLGADISTRNVLLAQDRIHACQAETNALRSSIAEVQSTLQRVIE